MPLPGTHIVHPQFAEHWRPTIAATFRSEVRLTRLGNPQGVRDPDTGRTNFPAPYVVYEGSARVQSRGGVTSTQAGGGRNTNVGDHIVTVGAYLLVMPSDTAAAKIGDTVKILSCPDTPALSLLTLTVVEVPAADVAFQRSYGCNLQEPTIRG